LSYDEKKKGETRMITLPTTALEIEEVKREKALIPAQESGETVIGTRPDVTEARVYRLRSGFVNNSVFITLGFIRENNRNRPIEIFINSKDLTRAAEYAVLTRLISAIFRKSTDPTFILEELRGIYDPNGGYFKDGKYIHSFYAEIAKVIEQFFEDIGVTKARGTAPGTAVVENRDVDREISAFKICPKCGDRSVKIENGCMSCVNEECGYSKCDE
jgi:ribonucleoside-diphosphate reductase alpha chain